METDEKAEEPAGALPAAVQAAAPVRHHDPVARTVDLMLAYVANNTVPVAQLPGLIEQTHRALVGLSTYRAEPAQGPTTALSVSPGCIVCLEDGKSFKSLKRHLAVHHGLTPDAYRAKWNLPRDYPMVAPDYAENRSRLAIANGLGRTSRRGKARNGGSDDGD